MTILNIKTLASGFLRLTNPLDAPAHPWGAIKPIWAIILGSTFVAVAAKLFLGLSLNLADMALVVAIAGAVLGISAFYTFKRVNYRIARLYRAAAELFLLTILVGSLSYAATSLDLPLWDEAFMNWDRAIGFDWKYWLAVLDRHPGINVTLVYAYHSMWPQLGLVIIALVTVQNYERLDILLLSFGLSALATVAIAGLMPALSPLPHLQITPQDHPNITLAVPRAFEMQALALRAGTLRIIDLGGAQGLVTFPSFHTVTAILLTLGFWGVPYLRWVALVVNAVMLLSIPIEGSHYLVDVFAGIGVALLAWAVAARMVARAGTSGAASVPAGAQPALR